jgi:hypothetical protein
MTSLFNGKLKLSFFTNVKRYDIEDADIEFEIITNLNPEPNQATIKIHNLAESTRNLFTADHQGIEFYAARNATEKPIMIFRGETTNVLHDDIDPGYLTTIFAGDGDKSFSSIPFNKSYKAGTLVLTILKDLASAMNLPTEVNFFDIQARLLRSETFSGLCKDALNEVTKDYGLKWSIQQGILEIINLVQPIVSQPTAVLISADTGMIGAPIIVERQENKQNTKQKGKKKKENRLIGVNVTNYLDPEIKPGRLVQIHSETTIIQLGKLLETKIPNINANGIYRTDVARYIGGNLPGNRFDVEVEADKMRIAA